MIAHPAVSRTWATLRIWAESLDPDVVTSRLGIEPSRSWRVGDRFGKDGRNVHKHGRWSITSEEIVVSTDLEEHIAWIFEQVEPARYQLVELISEVGVQADVFCFWEMESFNAGIVLSPTLMGRAAALKLTIGIDIYAEF